MTTTAPNSVPLTAKTPTEVVATARDAFRSGVTRPLEWRRQQLERLKAMLIDHEQDFLDALKTDLGKPAVEGYVTDIAFVLGEIDDMLKNLEKWNRPIKVKSPIVAQPAKSRRIPEPLGVVLVIAPWNYPIQLLLVPVAGAIAAGNAVVMKPSEVSQKTSETLARLVPRYLDNDAVVLVEGGVDETTELLAQHFDHIFYTGNGTVGRIVMSAAAKNLTPVTLELGGKSPVIIDSSAKLKVAARRVAWGKWMNAGQTCIAPDYVLLTEDVHDDFIDQLASAIRSFYGSDPQKSESYGRIVSDRHFNRLRALMSGGQVVIGGRTDSADRFIEPTVLTNIDVSAAIMNEEIFGPILPIVKVKSLDDAIEFVNARPHPLALYVFAESDIAIDAVIERTTAGGVTVNGTIMHITNPNLPFGGIGESGMGSYHGETSVRLFQHLKPVLRRSTKMDPSLPYPPYNARKAKIFRKVL